MFLQVDHDCSPTPTYEVTLEYYDCVVGKNELDFQSFTNG